MKYMIMNPLTGGYTLTEDESQIQNIAQNTAIALYLSQTYNDPVRTLKENGDGTFSVEHYTSTVFESYNPEIVNFGPIELITPPEITANTSQ